MIKKVLLKASQKRLQKNKEFPTPSNVKFTDFQTIFYYFFSKKTF